MNMAAPIDTQHVSGRRALHFTNLQEVLAEMERLGEGERAGRLRCLGNWTAGQNLGHLAAWIGYSFEGVPFSTPWFVKWMMRPMKKSFLWKPMRPGLRIPRLKGGTAGMEVISFEEGMKRLRAGCERLEREKPTMKHALFGKLTHEEWKAAHLRHAELHLSFMDV